MEKKIGIGIIGYGSIGGHHLKAINDIDQAHVVAVSTRNVSKLNGMSELEGIAVYDNHDDLINDESVDMVSICTPSGFHLEPALKAAAAGKHVMVEKPLEINIERSKEMIAACKEHNVKLACIFQNRYSNDFLKLKKRVQSGDLGKLVLANAYIKWFREQAYYDTSDWKGKLSADGGAALINQGIHTIDLLLDVMGDVKSVRGKVATISRKIEGEDLGVAILEFENGALGTIEGSTSILAGFPEKIEIHGDQGSVILEKGELVHDLDGPIEQAENGSASGSSNPMAIDYQLHKAQMEEFVKNILEDTDPTVDGLEAIRAVEVINAIYESSRTNEVVYLK
ncbi:MAG: UDP-N-acetyl-2-amino-2-deoxyglucuronate dehydrogenase [Cyclobacteriaceae bacterium]|jgi:predicted dehydrogenase